MKLQGASSSSGHTQKAKTIAVARERFGEMVESYLNRPHSGHCRQLSLTQRLVLFSVKAKVTLTAILLQSHSTRLTLSGASSWTA